MTCIEYTPLSETSYGEPDGLFGINCGHQQYPFMPGLSLKTYYPYDEAENAERYEETQRQRALERKIRADKRECMMLQEAGDTEGLQKAAGQLRADRDRYKDFCKEKGLGTHNENTQVLGYDRSKSMKNVWAEKKSLSESDVYYAKGNFNFGRIVGEKPPTKAMQKTLDQEYEKFCAVFGDINTIRSVDIQAYKNDNVYGTFGKNDGILTLFGAGGDEGMAFLSLSAREHKRNGQWSTGSPMHAFRHELGHAWQQQLKTSDPQFDEKIERIKNKKAEFWERLTSSPNYDKLDIINAEQKKILSIYGLDREYDIDELISECAAEYVSGKPRDFAREVIEILKEK